MPDASKTTLSGAICDVLCISDARQKATATRHLVAAWKDATLALGNQPPPDRPGRPDRPLLRPPREVPRRRITQSASGRIALLHAIAHIELNAVDLALDMASRFTKTQLPVDFYHDWLGVADDEARHFLMLSDRLADLDAAYGDLPAHDGLWQAADATKHDLLARLTIAPLVLEARGLDVTPTMIDRLKSVGDDETANALGIIMTDEITHVSVGKRWFDYMCGMDRLDPVSTWHSLVKRYFHGDLKPPFNIAARNAARFSAAFYGPLATRDDLVASPGKRPNA
jgi:uncharacterized ferritin-like protein (DUF455 family)